jgi:CubicO group peptidase (beta-lactamase class C family)
MMRHHRPGPGRRVWLVGLAVFSSAVVLSACAGGSTGSPHQNPPGTGPSATLAPAPPPQPPPLLTSSKVDAALAKLDGVVRDTMTRTGVPGMAVAVVYRDEVRYSKGFGVRQVGRPEVVGPDTVFQLASVSKPLASTVVSGVVGQGSVTWSDPVVKHDPGFALNSRWVSEQVTIADLFAHRTGLPDHAGDLLEDLGYDRSYILAHLRDEPLTPFRASYAYTNFGLTEAALAVAKARGMSWEDLSAEVLYKPAGMSSTSSRLADYEKAPNKAVTHVRVDGGWQAKYTRDADAQSPAGGASSTVADMAQWMRLQLANGKIGNRQIIDGASLEQTHLPAIMSSPPMAPAGRAGFYGLGWNISYDDHGRPRLNHSGAFGLGAATTVTLLPSEQLGIVVLTNGEPIGAAEAVASTFFDIAQDGRESINWLDLYGKVFAQESQSERSKLDYATPAANAVEAMPAASYVGTYANGYYGPLTVSMDNGALVMRLGPKNLRFELRHYNGNTFSYQTVGENAVGRSGVTFIVGPGGSPTAVTVENLDHTGLGTFTRS